MAQGLAWTREHNARAAAVFQRPVPAHRGRATAAGRVTTPATAADRATTPVGRATTPAGRATSPATAVGRVTARG